VLTAPVACGNLIAVATMDDSAEAKAHYLMLLDAKILNETMDNPIIHVLQIPTYVRDLAFVNESTIVCAVGGGDIHVYIIDPETRAMTLFQGMGGIHSKDIRQLAVNGFETHIVATAGNDKNLVVTDLKANVITFRVPHDTGLNGVKFNQYSASMSVITDNGVVLLYDARAKYEKPQFIYNSRLPHLYSHEYVNDHSVLIGFGDGAMHHIDMRSPKEPVWRTNDPYATGIGRIKYNPRANAFVTSGYTDFSVYRHHCEPGRNNSAEIWSHSLPIREKSIESKLLSSFDADFFDDTTIMTTNSDGYLAMYKQDFTVYD
jgi:WD40 repeat protein